ncbi:hypothetical protein B7494_g276 [Chlorociboria aeruginascens]|nr:hypothetical protein B7494_g276 [Chlorociboria aeruginascens]
MASTKESRYSTIEREDHDLENDSDTTLASEGFLKTSSKRQSRHSRTSKVQNYLTWLRWGFVVGMQTVIILILSIRKPTSDEWNPSKTETGGDINGLYVPTSHSYVLLTPEEDKFIPNLTSDANRMEIRNNWDMLMPLGSGTVVIPDWEKHPMLGKPVMDDPIHTGSIYEASWTHAIHCVSLPLLFEDFPNAMKLYYTVDTYHQLVVNNKFGFDGERNDYHASHCFEYLRQQILCMADMTLEGSESALDATGKGQAHMCRNREEAVSWIEQNRVDDIRSVIGP